jgi:hypothetical protein
MVFESKLSRYCTASKPRGSGEFIVMDGIRGVSGQLAGLTADGRHSDLGDLKASFEALSTSTPRICTLYKSSPERGIDVTMFERQVYPMLKQLRASYFRMRSFQNTERLT